MLISMPSVNRRWRHACLQMRGVRVSFSWAMQSVRQRDAIPDNVLLRYCAKFDTVTELSLASNRLITYSSWKASLPQLPQLTHLDLRLCCQVTDCWLYLLSVACTALKSLNLRACHHITDEGISHLSQLHAVNFRSCYRLTDVGICNLLRKSPDLSALDISSCFNLTPAAFGSNPTKLKWLSYDGREWLPKTALANLQVFEWGASYAPSEPGDGVPAPMHHLHKMVVGPTVGMHASTIDDIVEMAPNLIALDLAGCTGVCNKLVSEIHTRLPRLISLNVFGTLVTPDGLVAAGTWHLEEIMVSGTPMCTNKFTEENFPDLKRLYFHGRQHIVSQLEGRVRLLPMMSGRKQRCLYAKLNPAITRTIM